MISAEAFDAYNKAVAGMSDGLSEQCAARILAFCETHPNATVEEIREFAIEVMDGFVQVAGEAAAALAAEWYDARMSEEGLALPAAITAAVFSSDSVNAVARYQARKLVQGDMKGFAERCGEYVRNEALRSLNETIIANVARDTPQGVRYARVTTGRSDCAFCLMLESRGAVYHSRETAGEMRRYHRGCDCKVVPGVADDEFAILVEGHDPREAYDRWQELEKEAEATREEKRRRKQAAGLETVRREAASMTEDARAILGNRELASIIDAGTLSELADRVSDAGRSKDKARNMAARLFTMAITSGDKIRLTGHDGSFFNPADGKVYLDDFGAKDIRTIIHEFGHFLDFKLGKSIYASTRSPLLDCVRLQRNEKTESWSKLCESIGAANDGEARKILLKIVKEYGVYGSSEMSVSDIIHAISNGSVLLSYGHFDGYWNSRTRVIEIWAEFMAMILMNENEATLIRRMLPDESAILERFLEKINDEIRL